MRAAEKAVMRVVRTVAAMGRNLVELKDNYLVVLWVGLMAVMKDERLVDTWEMMREQSMVVKKVAQKVEQLVAETGESMAVRWAVKAVAVMVVNLEP